MGIPVMVELNAAAGGFFSVMSAAATSMMTLSRSGELTAAGMAGVGKALGVGITAAAGIVAVKSIEMAADFETAMTKLQTDAGETAQQLPGLADGFKTLATQVGYTATELATADWHVASSGFHDVADNLKVMTAAAEGARVGGSDLEETTQALSRVMVAFHLPADQATGAMNALIESTSRGDARLEDMTQAMTNVLPAASAAGVGLDQVLGAMSTMTAQGEDAASAGTHLRATLLNLSGGTTEASKAMADYGIQADQVKATLQGGGGITGAFDMLTQKIGEGTQGFSGYLDQLRAAGDDTDKFDSILASMPAGMESPIGALEKMVGGVRSFQAVLELTGANAGEFKDNVNAIGESMGNAGDKVQSFGEWASTTNGKMAQFKGSMSDLGITLGEDLLPAFTKFLDAANKVAQFMADHPAVADALAFSIGTVLVIALGAATVAAWNFTVAMLGTGIPELIALIALLAFGIYELTQHWQGFNNVLDAMDTEPMQHASENTRHAISDIFDAMNKEPMQHASDNFRHAMKDIYDAMNTEPMQHASDNFRHAMSNVLDAMKTEPMQHASQNVRHAFGDVVNAMNTEPMQHASENVRHAFGNVVNAMNTEPMQHASENVRHAMGNVANAISTGLDTAAGFVKQRMSEMGQHISNGWATVASTTSSWWSTITSSVSNTWNTLVALARQYWNDIVSAVGDAMSRAWAKVVEIGTQIGEAFTNTWNTCVQIVRGFIGQFVSVGGDIVRGIISGVMGAAGGLYSALRSLASNALNAAKSALHIGSPSRLFADEIGQHISTGIAAGISEHGGTIEKAVKMVTDPKNFGFSGIGSGAFSFAGGAGQFQGQASGSLNGAQFHLTVQGNVYGHGGIDQAAQDIWQQFLKMQRRGTLGFQLNV